MPIEHIVIIVKENHTFDNYFGTFPGANGAKLKRAKNPPPSDPAHDHATWMKRAKNPNFRVQYTQKDIPAYFDLARQFTLCDNYHAEVTGPSTPNHLMLICADAPIINNPKNQYNPTAKQAYALSSLPMQLEKAKLSWGNYGGYAFHYVKELAGHMGNHTRDLFVQHATAGKLPAVSWVFGDGRLNLSEHPTQNVTPGSNWSAEQIQAVIDGGLWDRSAIFITWDDWGGWYDHVTPPVVETWNHRMAQHPADAFPQFDGDPFRYGSRVPCLAVGPYAKAKHISNQLNSHVSLIRFCEDNFGLSPINKRAADSNGMSDCFDLKQKPLPPPKLHKA